MHAITQPVLSTVYAFEEAPGTNATGGITLLLLPTSQDIVSWRSLDTLVCPIIDNILAGIRAHCAQNLPQLRGVQILLCAWFVNPFNADLKILEQVSAYSIQMALEASEVKPWGGFIRTTRTEFNFPSLQQLQLLLSQGLSAHRPFSAPAHRISGFLSEPILSHVSGQQQITVTLKPIAPVARPCVIDKRSGYFPQDQPIFERCTEMIRSDLPEHKGFEVLVNRLEPSPLTAQNTSRYTRNKGFHNIKERHRQAYCQTLLKAAIQQALYVA